MKTPSTKFDIQGAIVALDLLGPLASDFQELLNVSQNHPSLMGARQKLEHLGISVASLFKRGDAATLRDLSKALAVWTDNKKKSPSRAETICAALIQMHKLFPPGKPRHFLSKGRLVQHKTYSKIAVRHVVKNLKLHRHGIAKGDRREIARQAEKLGFTLDKTPGKPKHKL